jgi:hypothetical protein
VNLKRPLIPDKSKLPEIFRGFCETTARQHALGQMPLADAVDWLHDWAVTRNLVDELGEDAVQAIMADAFALVRIDIAARALPRRDGVAQSTLDAATYLDQVGDGPRFARWLEEHHPDDQAAIIAYLERKRSQHGR